MTEPAILANYPGASRWSFGDNPALADELLQLVLDGQKTATCCSYVSYQQEQEPLVGDYNVVLDGRGEPACIIRILSLRLIRYEDVTAEMAALEGEGDKSLAFWQQGHREFFTREGTFSPQMWLVFQQFERVETL
ncbi:ASCH domain-containing protein [Pseudomonas lundensis]|uniref:ASCH domain-containing protein n=1 Tax=Serratia proteamaculans TaxID=28151 RepID=UPI002980BDCD|nr:ASCH domain-containing protein [Serratia proteamaculans]MDW5501858.1 ASCH domain-containing protein [Serratia proteamaculans]MDW5506919.1 ASCH domain-containing protein [Pseudomonas lundensis]